MKKQSTPHTKLFLTALPLLAILAACLLWLPSPPAARAATQSGSQNGSSVNVCGVVSAYKPATAGETGAITIGGLTFTIARNVALPGVSTGAGLCINFCFDAAGQASSNSTVGGSHSGATRICGVATKFVQAVGGARGLLVIGGISFPIAEALQIPGQNLAVPGASVCLTPVISGGVLLSGSTISAGPDLQFKTLTTVDGVTVDGFKDTFILPDPTVFTVQTPAPAGTTVFEANQETFGTFYPLGLINPRGIGGMMLSTPNSTVRAVTCAESFWDGVFHIASQGLTEGDLVTFYLQNPDGSNLQTVVMFTNENGEAKLTQVHPDVTIHIGGNKVRVGATTPYSIFAGNSGYRTAAITMVFAMSSSSLNGCYQMVAEIKRGAGAGKTTLVVSYLQVKRMERIFDRDISYGVGLVTGVTGWFPTGLPCGVVCSSCLPPPPPPPPAGLSGYVFCDSNDDGIKQGNEPGLAGVKVTLSGTQSGEAFTNSDGFYAFKDLPAGVYKLTETQPSGVMDGKDTVGTLGGDVSDDMFSNIMLPQGGTGEQYNFAEKCMTTKCDTICWRATQHFLNNSRYLPGGAILIAGVNLNNPVGIQQNLTAVRTALQGGPTPMQKLNREFVTAQLSLAGAGGTASPIVFNVYWSPLSCSGVSFSEITLSTGFKFTPSSLLNDLVEQTTVAIKTGRSADFEALAGLWALLNGRC